MLQRFVAATADGHHDHRRLFGNCQLWFLTSYVLHVLWVTIKVKLKTRGGVGCLH